MVKSGTQTNSDAIQDLRCSSTGSLDDTKALKQNSINNKLNRQIKEGIIRLAKCVPFIFPATCWYFTSRIPDNAITPDQETWSCMMKYIEKIATGEKLCLSAQNPGCSGAACYLGFKESEVNAGSFLARKEKFKKSIELGNAFYAEIQAPPAKDDYLVLERIDNLEAYIIPEVITLWVDATSLSGLVTLANYDRPTNDNVLIPFASGCQSIWTIPYKEKIQNIPKCIIGLIDPAARLYLPHDDILSFSIPINRFIELVDNISDSFLESVVWNSVVRKKHGLT